MRRVDFLDGAARAIDRDLVARSEQIARDIHALAVDEDVVVADDLPSFGAGEREPEAVDDVIEPALEEPEHLLARSALAAGCVEVIGAELLLENAVNAPNLLLFTEAHCVLGELHACEAVLTRRLRAACVAALVGVATLALQEELHPFPPAELADGSNVTSHVFFLLKSKQNRFTRKALRPGLRSKTAGKASFT